MNRPSTVWVGIDGTSWGVRKVAAPPLREARDAGLKDRAVASPMPGKVVAVHVAVGDTVVAGQPLAVVEAMKMEHSLTAPADGIVEAVLVMPGAQVAVG